MQLFARWKILIFIVLLGAVVRLVGLGSFPVGVTADEIQQGYMAYSILRTGHDEWGDFLPLNPRSFGDYRPPLYGYVIIPAEVIFGVDIFSVRLPSAIFGIATIVLIYFLALEIFNSSLVGLWSSFLLSISPWHIEYSRMGHESNVGIFFFGLGILLFMKGLKRNTYLILSALSFGLSIYSYFSFKLGTPLFLAVIFILYFREIKKIKWRTLALVGTTIFILMWFPFQGLFAGGLNRANDTAIYSLSSIQRLRDIQVSDRLPQPFNRIVNNRVEYIFSGISQNFLGYLSTTFLFSGNRSDDSVYNFPGAGLLYLWEIIPLSIGLYVIFLKKNAKSRILLVWLLTSLVPASLTVDYMHTQRVEAFLLCLPLVTGLGMSLITTRLNSFRLNWMCFLVVAFIITSTAIPEADFYLYHMFNSSLGGIHYGYQDVIDYSQSQTGNYNQIIFSKANSEPQAFVAFYSKMDPSFYQSYSVTWKHFETDGFKFLDMIDYSLGKYQFRGIDWNKDSKLKDTLLVATPDQVPQNVKVRLKTYDPTGKVTFEVIDPADN